jgi:hypothetical protein
MAGYTERMRHEAAQMILSGYCGLILRRVPAASHRDLYFVLASSRVTSRSPLQSSMA